MSVLFSERVVETTTTSGTGDYSLGGSPIGGRTFVEAFGSGKSVPYRVQNADNSIWEERYGEITDGSPDTLARGTFLRSSTGSTINWADSSTKYIFNGPQATVLDGLTHTNRGAARPVWLPSGGQWIDSDTETLYWYDGTADRPVGAVSSGLYYPYSGGTLQTYTEGSWTPAVAGQTTPGTQTYSTQVGRYIRSGNLVTVWFSIVMTAKDAATAGNFIISGLPFASSNVSGLTYPVSLAQWGNIDLGSTRPVLTARIGANSTDIAMLESGDNTGANGLVAAAITATTTLHGSATYRIN